MLPTSAPLPAAGYPFPGADFCRLDLDVAEVAEVIDAIRRLAPHVKVGR
ncbi:hypothetical protein NKH54_20750 [Mesorhizobium sp. M1004]